MFSASDAGKSGRWGARKILPYAKIAKYLAIGLEIPSTIVGSLIVGYLVDRQFGTSPWATVGAAVLGFFGAVYRLMQYAKYFSGGKDES